jgi:hypothetical protein
MKGSSAITMIHHLRMANEYCEDFIREHPNTRGAFKFIDYSRRFQWVLKDIVTYPHFRDEVRDGIRAEMQSDPFSYQSLVEKFALLGPQHRESLEEIVDLLLNNESIKVEKI